MKLKPVDPEQFQYLFTLTSYAMEGRLDRSTMPTMIGKTMQLEVEPGKVEEIQFKDHPVVRMMEVIASEVKQTKERTSMAARIYHLYGLIGRPEMSQFLREKDGEKLLHPAVVGTAATHPVDSDAGFADGFFEAASKLAAEMPDIGEP